MKSSPSLSPICLLFSIISAFGSFAQMRTAEQIVNQKIKDIREYNSDTSKLKKFVISMDFAAASILDQLKKHKIIGVTIDHIDLVYTDYPKGANLKKLNLERIKEVETFHPLLVQNPLIKWNIYRQTNCKTEEQAKSLFHGVVIYYQDSPNKIMITEIESELSARLPANLDIAKAKKMIDTLKKPTVNVVFNRNKHWNNAFIIVDLTASMIPYNSQVVLWHLLNTNNGLIKEVVLFNDGDSAPLSAKKVGKVGGLYYLKNINFDTLRQSCITACFNGLGNTDGPENDLEAVLFAIKQNPNANEYILIADNDAPPRDMELLDQIYRPIRIVLCDTDKGILPEYLEIARKTGGSVHTIKEDIMDLIKQKEGETFVVGGRKYVVKGGKIVVL